MNNFIITPVTKQSVTNYAEFFSQCATFRVHQSSLIWGYILPQISGIHFLEEWLISFLEYDILLVFRASHRMELKFLKCDISQWARNVASTRFIKQIHCYICSNYFEQIIYNQNLKLLLTLVYIIIWT